LKLSIIIVNWNGRHHLAECLPALRSQDRPPDEIIVVDNGSSDQTAEWLSRAYPDVCCVPLRENRGFTGGNIAGLAVASGDGIVLLNNDTKPAVTWLSALEAAALGHPECGAVASLMVDWDGRTVDSAGDGILVTGRAFQRARGVPVSRAPGSGEVFSACGGAVLYRRTAIEEVGFFDERFYMNAEDTELAWRLRLAGWGIWYCREAVVHHRGGASQAKVSDFREYLNHRNHLWTLAKCMPRGVLLKLAPWITLDVLAHGARAARLGHARVWCKGVWDGLREWRSFERAGRELRRTRRFSRREVERWFVRPRYLRWLPVTREVAP
jgi:GT2 family glycosyltransferase